MSQNVAPLTKIVALFGKKIWGAFWRLLEQKRAVSDSELLNTLGKIMRKSSWESHQRDKKWKNWIWKFHFVNRVFNGNREILCNFNLNRNEWIYVKTSTVICGITMEKNPRTKHRRDLLSSNKDYVSQISFWILKLTSLSR